MANRDQWRGFARGETGPRERDDAAGSPGRGSEHRSFGGAGRDTVKDPGGDAGLRADEARLNAELNRQERERGRSPRVEYGHDQNYRPGYHQGGSRFGFFGLGQEYGQEAHPEQTSLGGPGQGRDRWRAAGGAPYGETRMEGRNRGVEQFGQPADYAYRPQDEQDFDPDYLHWREQQMRRHDRDYAAWRRHHAERYDEEYRRFLTERRDDFHQRFQDWRAQRDAAAAAAAKAPDDKV